MSRPTRIGVKLLIAIWIMLTSLLVQCSEDIYAQSSPVAFPPGSKPYDVTYGEWTAKWWQWAISVPQTTNPILDKTGKDCAQKQSGPVWFLAGTSGGTVERTCSIPEGKAIFFPVLNNMNARSAPGETESDLRASIKPTVDRASTLEAKVDGAPLENVRNYRVESPFFNVTFPKNNLFGIPETTTQAVSDGYWVLLEPLPVGNHTIYIHAVSEDLTTTSATNNIVLEVTYHLTVLAEGTEQPVTLEGTSSSGKFNVAVNWTSNNIGEDNTFDLKFFDAKSGNEMSNVTYSIMLFDGRQHLSESHREHQTTTHQVYKFDGEGSYTLRVKNINGSGTQDGIDIPMQVTPEFPAGLLGFISMIAVFGAIIFAARRAIDA